MHLKRDGLKGARIGIPRAYYYDKLTLAGEVDVSRGDMLNSADSPAEVADQFEATLVWMAEEPMYPGRPYLLKICTRSVNATVTEPKMAARDPVHWTAFMPMAA